MVWNRWCAKKNCLDFFNITSASLQHDITGVLKNQFRTYNYCNNWFENVNNKNCLPQRLAILQPSVHKPGPQQDRGLPRSGPASSRKIFKLLSISGDPGLVSCLAPGQRAALEEAGRARGGGGGRLLFWLIKIFLQSLQVRNWICHTPVMPCYKEALVLRNFSKNQKYFFLHRIRFRPF